MLSEPRTVALITELIHIPMQHAINRLRGLYTQLCTECDFENFTRRPGGARIERPASEEAGLSRLTFSTDRIQFLEEGGLLTLDSFCRRLEVILERTMDLLSVPIFLMEQCTVRSVVSPGAFKSASDFIGMRLMNIASGDLSALGRPTSVFGFRLAVPPTAEHRDSYTVRIEVYARDPQALYLENVGTFRNPINRNDVGEAAQAMRDASTFVSDRLCPFLSRFDVAPEG
jgi:hypothetical protein